MAKIRNPALKNVINRMQVYIGSQDNIIATMNADMSRSDAPDSSDVRKYVESMLLTARLRREVMFAALKWAEEALVEYSEAGNERKRLDDAYEDDPRDNMPEANPNEPLSKVNALSVGKKS